MVDIPIEILFHILSFIPNDELNNLMLVNSDFYAYCSKRLSFKHALVINKDKVKCLLDLSNLILILSSAQ